MEIRLHDWKLFAAGGLALVALSAPGTARADDLQLHGSLGGAHAVGGPQQSEFGFGGGGSAAVEMPFARIVGVQVEVSALSLSSGSAPQNPALAPPSQGFDFGTMAGVRVHPFGRRAVAGLWVDGNGGVSFTGTNVRPALDTHLGYDFRIGGGRFDLGPFVGYSQIFESSAALIPGDAHIVWAGAHIALGAKTIRRDTDRDMVWDDEDACPRVPGIRTDDPRTNGCPRGDRDRDLVFDDEDACPDVPGIRTADAKTNGCPRPDRDHDLVFDDEDACPDVPGIRTSDPKTNGCPKPGDQVRLEGDKLVLDDIIHFELDSPKVPRFSWPVIKKVADFINANPDVLEIDIEGHADETGTSEHNMWLSRARAQTVRGLLLRFDVDAGRVATHAYGETRPRALGHTETQFRQNRRVEFTVTRSRPRQEELTSGDVTPSSGGTR